MVLYVFSLDKRNIQLLDGHEFSAIVLMNMAFALRPQWWIEDVKFDWKNIAGGVGLAVVCGEYSGWEIRLPPGFSTLPVRRWN